MTLFDWGNIEDDRFYDKLNSSEHRQVDNKLVALITGKDSICEKLYPSNTQCNAKLFNLRNDEISTYLRFSWCYGVEQENNIIIRFSTLSKNRSFELDVHFRRRLPKRAELLLAITYRPMFELYKKHRIKESKNVHLSRVPKA